MSSTSRFGETSDLNKLSSLKSIAVRQPLLTRFFLVVGLVVSVRCHASDDDGYEEEDSGPEMRWIFIIVVIVAVNISIWVAVCAACSRRYVIHHLLFKIF